MYTLDASVFMRDADPRDPEHAACRRLLEHLAANALPVIVPVFVLVEVTGALSRELRDRSALGSFVEALQTLPTLSLVALDDTLATEAAYLAADRALRGADAVYVAVAVRFGCQLVTLDQEMRTRAAPVVRVRTPADALVEIAPS
ncbi:MAG: PIN domain-containing protein [Chloroflexaceae bacterium]|nr:PIN domain-containing protein [Chloroflexaceae bacterium]